ncbi:5295_t:CDS:2 [Dentiscutata erythropus]|uniref:5295_t:CDS:1 n=1 Tax=Dentiscutata erythropus TaxID=1348616 RepID=A0A9N9ITW6_9GLOM|nr:5295_t:CDS:2 [Dentiscutata erythropus]
MSDIESESSNDYNKRFRLPAVIKSASKIYNLVEWKTLNQSLLNAKRQNKINQNWAEVYNNKINSMIKQSISDGCSTEISHWRKAYNLVMLVIEKSNDICLEDFLEEIRDLNITFNYLQEVEPAEFMTLLNKIVENYKLKIEIQ